MRDAEGVEAVAVPGKWTPMLLSPSQKGSARSSTLPLEPYLWTLPLKLLLLLPLLVFLATPNLEMPPSLIAKKSQKPRTKCGSHVKKRQRKRHRTKKWTAILRRNVQKSLPSLLRSKRQKEHPNLRMMQKRVKLTTSRNSTMRRPSSKHNLRCNPQALQQLNLKRSKRTCLLLLRTKIATVIEGMDCKEDTFHLYCY
eukprot:GSChrysophyteH1.ASY1.ANO1.2021.1 assembled CDS